MPAPHPHAPASPGTSTRPGPSTRQRIWKALRVQKTFDAPMLALAARAPASSTREFLGLLVRAGYVMVTSRGNGRAGRVNQYRLARNTGPFAPRRVFDFLEDGNTKEMFPLAKAQCSRQPCLAGGGIARQRERAKQAKQARHANVSMIIDEAADLGADPAPQDLAA